MSVIIFSVQDRVATVTLNRPEALNALNGALLDELEGVLNQVKSSGPDMIRAVIITGAGGKAFVAGADIKEINQLTESEALKFAVKGQKIFRLIEKLKVPVIAAVNGFALGGGLELALACDFIYAADNSKFGLPEVSLGLIPGFGGTVRLSRVVGQARAKEMILSGVTLNGAQAVACGLVNKVFPASELMGEAQKIATTIANRGPVAVAAAKAAVIETWTLQIDEALTREAKYFASLFSSQDVTEGTQAFIEKRKPQFQGS